MEIKEGFNSFTAPGNRQTDKQTNKGRAEERVMFVCCFNNLSIFLLAGFQVHNIINLCLQQDQCCCLTSDLLQGETRGQNEDSWEKLHSRSLVESFLCIFF